MHSFCCGYLLFPYLSAHSCFFLNAVTKVFHYQRELVLVCPKMINDHLGAHYDESLSDIHKKVTAPLVFD